MENPFIRNLETCAKLFAWFEGLFLFGFVSIPVAIFLFHWVFLLHLASFVLLIIVFGLLAYQIEYHPVVAVLWSAMLLVPYLGLIVMLILFIQVKTYLRKHDYKIGLWGARPKSPPAPEIVSQ